MKNNHANQNGFTLVEVTLALAVVLIGLMAVLGMVANGLKSSRSAAENCVPAMIANDIFNQCRGPYRSYVNATDLSTFRQQETRVYDINGVAVGNASPNRYYDTTIYYENVAGVPAAQNQYVARLRVQVCWPALSTPCPNTNTFITQVAKLW
jgi:uncharacterized protein (TIGR02598 family)